VAYSGLCTNKKGSSKLKKREQKNTGKKWQQEFDVTKVALY